MNTLYLNYTKTGQPIGDHECEEVLLKNAELCVNGSDKQFNVSTENVVETCRLLILQKKITCNVQYMFEGEIVPVNEYQVFPKYPQGFLSYYGDCIISIIRIQQEMHKTKKNGRV